MRLIHRESTIRVVDDKIKALRASQDRRESILKDIESLQYSITTLENTLKNIDDLILSCTSMIQEYRDEKLEELSKFVEEDLDVIFPLENFEVKLKADTYRNKERIRLLTGKDGHLSSITMQHGRFFRQLISFAVTTRIQRLKNCEPIFMDEALNSGDFESTAMMSENLREWISNNIQVSLIEHKEVLYINLPRLEYHLYKDVVQDKITEVTRHDYRQIESGEETP